MSAPLTVWWVRHGPTHARGMIGWTDLPADLGDTARLSRLSAHLPPDAPVISSDLDRARATAGAIAGLRPRLPDDPALREIHFGAWETRSYAEIEAEEPARLMEFLDTPGTAAPPGGECWDELATRVRGAVARLRGLGHANVIAVAHLGPILTQVQQGLRVPARDALAHRIDNLSVTRLHHDGRWRVGAINHCP